jgi:hypothetical protein
MKIIRFILFLLFLLTACSPKTQASIDETVQSAYSTPTGNASGSSLEDPILEGISYSLNAGPHALKYSCEDCHASLKDDAGQQLIWFNGAAGQTEVVATPTKLCIKCHPDQIDANITQIGVQPVHLDFGCTDCHNAHSTQANCTQSACHTDIQSIISVRIQPPDPHPTSGDPNTHMCEGSTCHDLVKKVSRAPIYHQPVHRDVPCYVCHDGTGMVIAHGTDGAWFTLGAVTQQSAVSHTIARAVECTKCHFPGNSWGLIESVSVLPTPISIP